MCGVCCIVLLERALCLHVVHLACSLSFNLYGVRLCIVCVVLFAGVVVSCARALPLSSRCAE